MFIIGTLKQWKTLSAGLAPEGKAPPRVLIQSMDDKRRTEILASIEHLREDVEIAATDTEPARTENRPTDAWATALHQAFGRECIKAWEGFGEQIDDEVVPLPCTPEHIDLLMKDERVSTEVLMKINEVNARIVAETAEAGNA